MSLECPRSIVPAAIAAALAPSGTHARAVSAADLDWLRELYAGTRAHEFAGVAWPPGQLEAFLAQQFEFQHRGFLARHPAASFLAIETVDGPVGRLYVERTAPEHVLIDIALQPASQGRGLGTALVSAIQQDAAAAGRGVALHVAHDNPRAFALYRRLGFVEAGDTGSHRLMRWRAVVS